MSPERFAEDFRLKPVLAVEIEFYLLSSPPPLCIGGNDIKIEQERGENQWEVALAPAHAEEAVRQGEALKAALAPYADFRAKPYADQPGSGLHVHVHLEDAAGGNVFFKRDEEISDALKWSIGGLLATMRENMPVFAPTPESRARFVAGGTAPTTVSWGANNRTCAIRLPDAGAPHRHIEHRVAGADADIRAVVEAILAGMHYGLANRCEPGAQTYGEAWREEYGLPLLLTQG